MTTASAAFSQEGLPDDEGKELVERMCVGCHGVETVTAVRLPETLWFSTVDNMVARGAVGTDEEIDTVVDYLTRHFGADPDAVSATAEDIGYVGVVRAITR
ncbi:MAG: cytochrome c, partial [Pseudomonadales bacterium]